MFVSFLNGLTLLSAYLSMRHIDAWDINTDCEWSFRRTFFELLIAKHATGVDGCGSDSLWRPTSCCSNRCSTGGT